MIYVYIWYIRGIAELVGIVSAGSQIHTVQDFINDKQSVSDIENIVPFSPQENKVIDDAAIIIEGSIIHSISTAQWDFIFTHREMIFARTTPEQKLLIVTEMQKRGHRVGVTGDGVNGSA